MRFWKGRPLTLVEGVLTASLGVLVCFAIVPGFIIVAVLCINVGSGSLAELLAAGTLLCLFATLGLGIDGFIRGRHGHHSPWVRPRFALASLFGVIACISLTAFAWLRAHDAREQQQTVGALQNAPGVAYYDYEVGHDGHLESKSTSWAPELFLLWTGKDFFHHVVRVDLKDTARDVDVLIPHLEALPRLRFVSIPEWTPTTQVRELERELPSCNFRIDRTPRSEHIGGDDDFSTVSAPK
jgi:hypothetical protein